MNKISIRVYYIRNNYIFQELKKYFDELVTHND